MNTLGYKNIGGLIDEFERDDKVGFLIWVRHMLEQTR